MIMNSLFQTQQSTHTYNYLLILFYSKVNGNTEILKYVRLESLYLYFMITGESIYNI